MIPKIIHQVWAGPMVAGIQKCLDSVKRHNPDCDIRLYGSEDLRPDIPGSFSLVAATDILRHQKLFEEGGYYIDADCYCFKSLDFNRRVTFGQQEPSDHPSDLVEWAMGSEAGHPLLESLLKATLENVSTKPYNGYAAQKELTRWGMSGGNTVSHEWAGSRYFAKVNRSFVQPKSPTLVHLFLTSWVTVTKVNLPYIAGWPKVLNVADELEKVLTFRKD